MNIGIVASGKLGFQSVELLCRKGIQPCFLFTDKMSLGLIALSKTYDIPLFVGNPRKAKGIQMIKQLKIVPDLILSINYLFLLESDIIQHPRYGCVNFHGSLLPKYRGRTPHVWAIINNEKVTGITAHYVDQGCDTGPIIAQRQFEIREDYTGARILEIFEQNYPSIILETLKLFENGRAHAIAQDENSASYFGKRTPDDGQIDWNWQKERINNWVRALADPYPGAFTFCDNNKIIIDKIEFTDTGFSWKIPNGTVITESNSPEVKTPNGVVKLAKCRTENFIKKGTILR